jgi:hypothetical protein
MTKRETSPNGGSGRQPVLITCQDGELIHYVEPSIVCAAQHAISVCDNEEGCAQAIEEGGRVVWKFDSAHPRQSLAKLDELAQGECVS